jgi:hypothetical protein
MGLMAWLLRLALILGLLVMLKMIFTFGTRLFVEIELATYLIGNQF